MHTWLLVCRMEFSISGTEERCELQRLRGSGLLHCLIGQHDQSSAVRSHELVV